MTMQNLPFPAPDAHLVERPPEAMGRPVYRPTAGNAPLQVELKTYLDILRRRKWLIIAPLLIVVPIVGCFLVLQHPTYEATATLLIEPSHPKILNIADFSEPDKSLEYYKAQYSIIRSRLLMEQVMHTLPASPADEAVASHGLLSRVLQGLHALLPGAPEVPLPPEEMQRRESVEKLRERTRVEPISTGLVEVTIAGSDPLAVTAQVNALAEIYVSQNLGTKLATSQQASAWLTQKLQELKGELQQAERTLQNFLESRGLLPSELEEKQTVAPKELEELNTAYTALHAQHVHLEAQLRTVRQLSPQASAKTPVPATAPNTPRLDTLRKQQDDFAKERIELAKSLTPKHPKMLANLAQLTEVKKAIHAELQDQVSTLDSEYRATTAKMAIFEKLVKNKREELIKSKKYVDEYTRLKNALESKKAVYEGMVKRFDETEVTKSLQTNNARIFQKAVVPIKPVPKKTALKVLVSVVVVTCLGLGAVFIAETLDGHFKNPDDVEEFLQIPFLGMIPAYSSRPRSRLIALEQPRSAVADCYRILRTNLQMLSTQRQLASLLVTSAVAGEGKTTTVGNLGVSFAQLGWTVLLVDADLRHASLHKVFNLENHAGFSDILRGSTPKPLFQDSGIDNLKVIASGPPPDNPAELLIAKNIKKFCDEMRDAFDLIIFDSAITLSIPDAVLIAHAVDGVCLIHNPARSSKELVITAKKMLDRASAHILGITFNNISLKDALSKGYRHYYASGDSAHANKDDKKKGASSHEIATTQSKRAPTS